MWQLAMVQGQNITIFTANGAQRQNASDFHGAVAMLLKDGWEPMSAGDANLVVVWFRKKVG